MLGEKARCYQGAWQVYFVFHLFKACLLKVIVLRNRSCLVNMRRESMFYCRPGVLGQMSL